MSAGYDGASGMSTLPAYFVSHGAPTLATLDGSAHRFLKSLGTQIGKPEAILMVSAHHDSLGGGVAVSSARRPETIYDFRGFDEHLYELRYPAPGDPARAEAIVAALRGDGFSSFADPDRGLDHGAWVPLLLMYPDADVPVLQLSIDSREGPEWHFQLGKSLSSLRESGVLIIGSGSATHNLGEFFKGGYGYSDPPPTWVSGFADWLAGTITTGDFATAIQAVSLGPDGLRNHPTMDHILPLYVTLGAGGASTRGERIHRSTTYGVLSMDAYRID